MNGVLPVFSEWDDQALYGSEKIIGLSWSIVLNSMCEQVEMGGSDPMCDHQNRAGKVREMKSRGWFYSQENLQCYFGTL